MDCVICRSKTDHYLVTTVLHKYEVTYAKCRACGFINTEPPYWLEEAYSTAITSLDIGLPQRNLYWKPVVEAIIRRWFAPEKDFLDYGGGYGLFVRLMRDQGFNFYRQDTYCENLFAKYFDLCDRKSDDPYELVTAFEVFEHLPDPVHSVEHMLSFGDSILFSTELQPRADVTPETWWYFIPDTGQHVSLYTRESLVQLGKRFDLNLYTDGERLHMLTKKRFNEAEFKFITKPLVAKIYNKFTPGRRETLISSDFDFVSKQTTRTSVK